ncbi:MAG: efflux RND transporter periplasmic adaptor subunit [Planctomycetaceae bacterium]|nr:efflux RND transporter periplasmic adaptor subunit [Planctomycetaceae bacterium]
MPLEPLAESTDDPEDFAVNIPVAARRLANIETVAAEARPVLHSIETVGSIAIDESRQSTISAYVDGRLERLFADYTGVQVAKGDHLAILYSPSLFEQQAKYIEFSKKLTQPGEAALPAARDAWQQMVVNLRQRLIELGMTERQLQELDNAGEAQLRLTIYAPFGGTVVEKLAVEGQYVSAGEPIYRIANLSTVWLMLELYPEDAALIRFGQKVAAEVQSRPGEQRIGRVAFIDPVVDPQTRTVGVRVELLNDDRQLRPGDLATAQIEVPIGAEGEVFDADLAGKWISPMHPQVVTDAPGQCPICGMDLVPTTRYGFAEQPVDQPAALVVPRDAVLMAGQNSVVYVEAEPGRFEIRPVTLGPITERSAVVLSGVKAGEQVATSGNFLIDSQMQLAGKPSLIDPERAIAKANQPKSGPLQIAHIHVQPVAGHAGTVLEELYQAYFAVQSQLASDQPVSEAQAATLNSAAKSLSAETALSAEQQGQAAEIAKVSEHLHHQDLKGAREHFKTISRNITLLAFAARGADAEQPIRHFYCPMVKGGGGDWLQPDDTLANPYYGSTMLRCGELVHTLPPEGHVEGEM